MSIRFTCPNCKKVLKAPDGKEGAKLPCPGCKQPIQVPTSSTPPSGPPPAHPPKANEPLVEQPKAVFTPPTNQKKTPKKIQTWMIVAAGACLLGSCSLCCGGFWFIGNKQMEHIKKEVEDGNHLWESGKKAEAVAKYKPLLKEIMDDGSRSTILGRMIEYDLDQGDTTAAQELAETVLKSKLPVENPSAKQFVAKVQNEKDLKEKAEKERSERELAASKGKETSGPPDQSGGKYTVSKGFLSGDLTVELTPEVAEELALKDFNWDSIGTLKFKMTYKRLSNSQKLSPWDYSVFDKDNVKLEGGGVGFPDTISVGQTVVGEIFVGSENKAKATKILIDYR